MLRRKKKLGLVLGSGGARGWAHIGVVEAVRELDLPVFCVAGASMGALVGAAFAAGQIDALHQVALGLTWRRLLGYFLELNIPRSGLIDGDRIEKQLRKWMPDVDIRDLPLPYAAVATDLSTGDEVVLSEGNVITAVRASMAVPAMFTPVIQGNRVLVDGGLVNPLPVSVARAMGADLVAAVDITPVPHFHPRPAKRDGAPAAASARVRGSRVRGVNEIVRRVSQGLRRLQAGRPGGIGKWSARSRTPSVFDVLGNAIRVVEQRITVGRLQTEPPDILIRPAVGDFDFTEFERSGEAIRAGYEAGKEKLAELAR